MGLTSVTVQVMLYLKSLATCRSPTALKRPDRSKQCHCLQFAHNASQPLVLPLERCVFTVSEKYYY